MTGFQVPTTAPRRPLGGIRLPADRGRLAILVVLAVVGLFLTIQFGRQVYASWAIGQEAERVRQEIATIAQQNRAMREELSYLRSDAYANAEARRLQNLGQPGERVLIIPPGAEAPIPPALRAAQTPPKPMLEQWLELFFGG